MLNDKTDVNNLKDMYSKLSLVEYMENVNEYEDEYDDTYDDIDTAVGNEGNTEVEERYVPYSKLYCKRFLTFVKFVLF